MKPLRVSAISYLNTVPLMWDFEHGSAGAHFQVTYTIPSQCAASLKSGSADIGIIPAAAYASIPDLGILPGVAIASVRPVRSILLVSKVPRDEIRTVALDTSSLTSVALLKILFAKWWNGERSFTAMEPHIDQMLRTHDAGLVIGDPALRIDRSRYITYDLAEEWIRLTRKPFVFAFWAVRRESLSNLAPEVDLAAVFQQSRDHGLAPDSLNAIAEAWAPRLRLTPPEIRSYLTENIHYELDPDCIEGLQLFFKYACDCGALSQAPKVRFLEPRHAAIS